MTARPTPGVFARSCNAVPRRPDGTLYGDLLDGAGFGRVSSDELRAVAMLA